MVSTLSMSHCHMYAQKLNNSAALCIEIGHYDRAILSLTKALRLSRKHSDGSLMGGCSCHQCSLDGCIAYSEITPPVANVSTTIGRDMGCGYVYQRPIQIPPLPILENHNMGRTLFLIVTFNLAMAYHLSAMATTSCTEACEDHTSKLRRSGNKIKKALQLYEVSHNWHSRINSRRTSHECDASQTTGVSSIRFRIILSNNLSHIHRLGSNYTKQRQCLEHLLSTIMIAVEYKTRTSNDNDAPTEVSRNGELCTKNLEGFLMNASRLFLQENCAEAA